MRHKRVNLQISEEVESTEKVEEEHEDLQRFEVETSFRGMTQKERIQAARKPLYLRRYE